mgnify:CR=1 FL=1
MSSENMSLLKTLWEAFLEIFSKKIVYEEPPMKPVELDTPVPQETPHSKAWCGGTIEERKEMFQMAMRVCKEEGLEKLASKLLPGYTLRADVIATIHGESGFNRWCENPDTLDYGLCQFNKNTYLQEYTFGSTTPQQAIDNPEDQVRIMARNFKSLRRMNWMAFGGHKGKGGLINMPKDKLKAHIDNVLAIYS